MSEMESEIWGPRWMERRDPCRCRMAYDEGESGSADQRISGGMRPHGGAEARRKQREEPTTGHKGNWRVPCSCMCVETPVLVAHRCFTLPRSSSIIHPVRLHKYVFGRQVNVVCMGSRCATACTMYVLKITWSLLGGSWTKSLPPSS
jgi:hypothetical protein